MFNYIMSFHSFLLDLLHRVRNRVMYSK